VRSSSHGCQVLYKLILKFFYCHAALNILHVPGRVTAKFAFDVL
jgi:hypothetical protein